VSFLVLREREKVVAAEPLGACWFLLIQLWQYRQEEKEANKNSWQIPEIPCKPLQNNDLRSYGVNPRFFGESSQKLSVHLLIGADLVAPGVDLASVALNLAPSPWLLVAPWCVVVAPVAPKPSRAVLAWFLASGFSVLRWIVSQLRSIDSHAWLRR